MSRVPNWERRLSFGLMRAILGSFPQSKMALVELRPHGVDQQ